MCLKRVPSSIGQIDMGQKLTKISGQFFPGQEHQNFATHYQLNQLHQNTNAPV